MVLGDDRVGRKVIDMEDQAWCASYVGLSQILIGFILKGLDNTL